MQDKLNIPGILLCPAVKLIKPTARRARGRLVGHHPEQTPAVARAEVVPWGGSYSVKAREAAAVSRRLAADVGGRREFLRDDAAWRARFGSRYASAAVGAGGSAPSAPSVDAGTLAALCGVEVRGNVWTVEDVAEGVTVRPYRVTVGGVLVGLVWARSARSARSLAVSKVGRVSKLKVKLLPRSHGGGWVVSPSRNLGLDAEARRAVERAAGALKRESWATWLEDTARRMAAKAVRRVQESGALVSDTSRADAIGCARARMVAELDRCFQLRGGAAAVLASPVWDWLQVGMPAVCERRACILRQSVIQRRRWLHGVAYRAAFGSLVSWAFKGDKCRGQSAMGWGGSVSLDVPEVAASVEGQAVAGMDLLQALESAGLVEAERQRLAGAFVVGHGPECFDQSTGLRLRRADVRERVPVSSVAVSAVERRGARVLVRADGKREVVEGGRWGVRSFSAPVRLGGLAWPDHPAGPVAGVDAPARPDRDSVRYAASVVRHRLGVASAWRGGPADGNARKAAVARRKRALWVLLMLRGVPASDAARRCGFAASFLTGGTGSASVLRSLGIRSRGGRGLRSLFRL
jgi:hypothetical protein